MRNRCFGSLSAVGALALALTLAGCHHQAPPPPPAPAPAPPAPAPAPTITLTADPNSVVAGNSTTLTWQSQNAVRVDLNGAAVNLNGSQSVSPADSTDYQATATSADGRTANATVRVTVTQPPPPPPPPTPEVHTVDFSANVSDAFFDFDKSNIRPDAATALEADAQFLKANPSINIVVEGHCDDRGSAEYNMALGQRRAAAAQSFLEQQGVDASRIQTVSYGKERPFCTEDNEDCWQQNRRAHIIQAQGQ